MNPAARVRALSGHVTLRSTCSKKKTTKYEEVHRFLKPIQVFNLVFIDFCCAVCAVSEKHQSISYFLFCVVFEMSIKTAVSIVTYTTAAVGKLSCFTLTWDNTDFSKQVHNVAVKRLYSPCHA